jgi:hypothetical protein
MQHFMALQKYPNTTSSKPSLSPSEEKGLAEAEMVSQQLIREKSHAEVGVVLQQLAQEKENMQGLSAEEVRVRVIEGEPVKGVSELLYGNVFSGEGKDMTGRIDDERCEGKLLA